MPSTHPPPARLAIHPDGSIALDRPPAADRLLLPAMVNAHAHLELHRIGPRPYDPDAGFAGWVEMLREHWPGEGDPMKRVRDTGWMVDAARAAAQASLGQGVTHVGDIAHAVEVVRAWQAEGLGGVGYLEMFGLGPPFDAPARGVLKAAQGAARAGVDVGLQPHAPYSAGPTVFDAASRAALRLSTHLAETPDELAFVAKATGPFRDLLERIGKWRPEFAASYTRGLTPIGWMRPYLEHRPWLLAHANYLTDEDIDTLAGLPEHARASVVYCPIASEYFGHRRHRYRDLIEADINVCLGTDSVVCQPTDEAQPYAVLPQMRRLYRRDGTDPATLVRMATVNGAQALGLSGLDFTTPRSWIAIDAEDPTCPLEQVLRSDRSVRPFV
ncbi:MAG: amidohydrolase family protein [Planctomycetota bacterium]